ncbi:MAG: helix-turn-helix transcriptional regulator [Balneolaceae bacterium]
MDDKEKKKKFWDSIEGDNGKWSKKARSRRENKGWLRKSQRIAVRVLSILNERGMQQKELAEAMDVTPQQISKIVKGKQNLTLSTISKLEAILGVKLFVVPVPQVQMEVEKSGLRTSVVGKRTNVARTHEDLSEINMQLWKPSSNDKSAA